MQPSASSQLGSHQGNSPGGRGMTHGVSPTGLTRDSHGLAHLSATHMVRLVFSSQQGNSSTLLGDHLQMFNQRETLHPTESKQTAPPRIWGLSAPVQIRKIAIFVMVVFVVQKQVELTTLSEY